MMEAITAIEEFGGAAQISIVAVMNDNATFTWSSEGSHYAAMLGAIEHLKLKYYHNNENKG